MIFRSLLLLFALTAAASANPADELLPAEKAFRLRTSADGGALVASWEIAPGYYLYRDKFRFESLDPSVRLQGAQFPAAATKQDPFFGPMAIYTQATTVRVPFETTAPVDRARFRITSQGCNEPVGVCYPPATQEVSVRLADASAAVSSSPVASSGGLPSLTQALGLGAKDELSAVDPEKAFLVQASVIDGAVAVRFTIDDCCYLYRDKTAFSLVDAGGARLGPYQLPPGETYKDEFSGKTEVYRRLVEVRVPLLDAPAAGGLRLRVAYQGCSEKGVKICYPPTTRDLTLNLAGGAAMTDAGAASANGFLWAMFAAFAGGLLLTFTPCVLPMIPILSGVIVGAEGTQLTKARGGLLSYTYVLGTAVTYAIAGAVAGATGQQLQAYFQNVWAIGLFAVVLVALALSMFGFYELQVPASIQSLLHRHSGRLHHKTKASRAGEFIGVFVLGAISALIIGACVAPVLAFTLTTAIAARDPWLGAGILFALAHGQGAILVALGVSEGFLLPRAGPWMQSVKHFFGALLIAVAIYLLGTLPEVPVLYLWAAFFIVCAIYLGATQRLRRRASGWLYLRKGVGTLLFVWGVAALLGAFLGGRDILSPLPLDRLSIANDGAGQPPASSLFRPVRSVAELDAALGAAKRAGKPVLLDYYATWCTDCVRMERSTFLDADVRDTIAARFVALQVDLTAADDPATNAVKRRFDVYGPPALLFFGADGGERRDLRAYGYLSATELLAVLARL